ncbi:MAG TPA: CobW family GTP-binding protein [Luteimicrobium sp.]|nr:CobW family GTP-binding protein [Luteimicrobium sp.]
MAATGTLQVPVVVVSGFLGSGKTTLLNRLLQAPGARVGVVINDFGQINVDAGMVSGQIDAPASIAGGCLCCLPDAGGLDDALERLADPRRRLDVIIVEASGVADPIALRRTVRFSGVEHVRPGGLVEVVDAGAYDALLASRRIAARRFAAASLVVLNKVDRAQDPSVVTRVRDAVLEHNPAAVLVTASHGKIDPELVFDVAATTDAEGQLPLGELVRETHPDHVHADAVTVRAPAPVEAGLLVDLLEDPPASVYRLKGSVLVDAGRGARAYAVNVVGRHVHVSQRRTVADHGLVAIGIGIDRSVVTARLERTLRPAHRRSSSDGVRRLVRYKRLSA